VFTHAYEGGHPDHDAVAFAVHAACRLSDIPPAIVEMPYYHRQDGRLITGEFPTYFLRSRRRPGSIPQTREPPIEGSRPSPEWRTYAIKIDGEALRRKQ